MIPFPRLADLRQDPKAIHPRHLNVQQYKVKRLAPQRDESLSALSRRGKLPGNGATGKASRKSVQNPLRLPPLKQRGEGT